MTDLNEQDFNAIRAGIKPGDGWDGETWDRALVEAALNFARRQHGSAAQPIPPFDFAETCTLLSQERGKPVPTMCPRCKNPHHVCDHGSAAQAVAKVEAAEFGRRAVFLANGQDLPKPGTLLYAAPPVADLTAAVDAAMVEMANIHPPLRRSECERLIRAALSRRPAAEQPAAATPWLETEEGKAAIAAAEADAEAYASQPDSFFQDVAGPPAAAGNALTDEQIADGKRIIAELLALESAKKPGAGVHGQTIGCEPWVIRTNGFGLQCLNDAAHFINSAIEQHLRAAPQAAQGKGLPRDQIRSIFMAHGFTIKEGQSDLKDYVYAAADALLAAHTRASDGLEALIVEHRAAITPEYEGGFHADLYGDEAEPQFKGFGKTPREAISAAMQQAASNQQEGAK